MSDDAPSRMLGEVEERILRCDVCNHAFVLAYRRVDGADCLASSHVTSQWVRCPSTDCHHLQPVIVPYEGGVVSVAEWLGSSGATPLGLTYREVLGSGSPGRVSSTTTHRPRRWVVVDALRRLLSRLRRGTNQGAAEQ